MADFIRSIIRSTAISTSCENNQNIEKQFLDQSGCRRDFLSEGRGKNFLQMNGFLIFLNLADTSEKMQRKGIHITLVCDWVTCQNGKVLERVSFGKLRVLPVMDLLHLLPLLSRELLHTFGTLQGAKILQMSCLFHEWGSLFQRCDIKYWITKYQHFQRFAWLNLFRESASKGQVYL